VKRDAKIQGSDWQFIIDIAQAPRKRHVFVESAALLSAIREWILSIAADNLTSAGNGLLRVWWVFPLLTCLTVSIVTAASAVLALALGRDKLSTLASRCYLVMAPLAPITYLFSLMAPLPEPPTWTEPGLVFLTFWSAGLLLASSYNREERRAGHDSEIINRQ
jgi:hypothetical protein